MNDFIVSILLHARIQIWSKVIYEISKFHVYFILLSFRLIFSI